MGLKLNPLTAQFDLVGSGGGGASYIDGEVQNFSALPETLGTPAVDSAYLVREAEGTWLLNRKPAGIYVRTANTGTRASDWTYAGEFPDVFNDANFVLYDNGDSTKNLQFQLSGISTGTTRTLTAPNASGTIALTSQLVDTQVFTANGTWTKPAGAKLVHYLLIGGGGGGGSGRRPSAATASGGGAGGAGGGITVGYTRADFFGSTETITVGAGGAGAANAANNSNGGNGTAGGDSSFGSTIKAKGGSGGNGSTGGGNATGGSNTNATIIYATGAATGAGANGGSDTTTPSAAASTLFAPTGGGGGGGRTANWTQAQNGSKAGDIGQTNTGITAAGSITNASAGPAGTTSHANYAGTGGGGGSCDTTLANKAAFAGGAGALYGGGGGGGSASANDEGGSTAGGNGAQGIVVITTYF